MDQLEEWRVRGRLTTAAKRLREALMRLATEGEEYDAAMAEAEQLGLYEKTSVTKAGVGQ